MLPKDTPQRSQIAPLDVPQLSIRGPLALGILAVASFAAAASFTAQTYLLPQVSRLDASLVAEDMETIVRAPGAAQAVELFVKPGDLVEAGQKLAQLETADLNDRILKLASQGAAARWRLKTIRKMVAQTRAVEAGKSPGPGRMTLSSGLTSLKVEARNVQQIVRMLGARLAQAQHEADKSAIFAQVSGRVELLADAHTKGLPENSGGKGKAILKLVNDAGPVSVKVKLPQGLLRTFGLGAEARVILWGPHSRGPHGFPARLKFAIRQVDSRSGIEAEMGEAIFEIAVPRWQIAKQIELHSAMNAQVLIETGRQPLYRQLFATPL